MSFLTRLRTAASSAAEASIEFSGGDADELVALADLIGERENRVAKCSVLPGSPSVLVVRFAPPVPAAP